MPPPKARQLCDSKQPQWGGCQKQKHMILFRQISGEQFGIALGALLLLYYAAIGWQYYRPEITALLQGRQQEQPTAPETAAPPVIMGAGKAEEGVTELSAEELVFDVLEERKEDAVKQEPVKEAVKKPQSRVSPLMQQISRDHQQASLLGYVADVMEEMKTLLDMAKESGENKKGLLDALVLLAPKLQALSGTTYPDALKLYLLDEIRKRFAFEISTADLEGLWLASKKRTIKPSI